MSDEKELESNVEVEEKVEEKIEEVPDDIKEEIKEKPKFKLNPEIKGMLGILGVIVLIGLVISAATGKFEQWFGIDIFGGKKITNKIVYIENDTIKSFDVFSGKETTILEQKDIKDVAVSPNGKKIAFVGYENNVQQVFLMNADGKKIKKITTIEGSKAKPQFSPDGKYIAYIANGRVFRADINGANEFSILPTRQEQQGALTGRGGKLVMKDFVWAFDSNGMLGVVSRGEDDERLVLMSDANGDAHEVPFPEGVSCKFISLSSCPTMKVYSAVANMNGAYITFVIQEPEEHNHGAEITDPTQMGVMPVNVSKDKVLYSMVSPDGKSLIYSINSTDKKMPSGVYTLDFEKKSMAAVLPRAVDKIDFIYGDNVVLYNKDSKLQMLVKGDKDLTLIGEKVNSYCMAPQKEEK